MRALSFLSCGILIERVAQTRSRKPRGFGILGMTTTIVTALVGGFIVLNSQEVSASPVTYGFSGSITNVIDPNGYLGGTGIVAGGSTFAGSFTYDPTNSTFRSSYDPAVNANWNITQAQVSVDKKYTVAANDKFISVENNTHAPIGPMWDSLMVGAPSSLATFPSSGDSTQSSTSSWALNFIDTSATAFKGTSLPPQLSLSSFNSATFSLGAYYDPNRGAEGIQVILNGDVTKLYKLPTIPLVQQTPLPGVLTGTIDPSKGSTIVVTHGWQPTESSTSFATPQWMLDMKGMIGSSANIVLKTWEDAATKSFSSALAQVAMQGIQLGQQLYAQYKVALDNNLPNPLEHLHMVGHSLGSYVNAYAVDYLGRRGVQTEQFTILDRPFGNGLAGGQVADIPRTAQGIDTPLFQQLLGNNVKWVDNYYGITGVGVEGIIPAFGASFEGEGPTAKNFGIYPANHSDVHYWYRCTMDRSWFASHREQCEAFNYGPSVTVKGQGDEVGYGWSYVDGFGNLRWSPGVYTKVSRAVVYDPVEWLQLNCTSEYGVTSCAEGSPAYFWNESFTIPTDAEFLSFDFRWLNLGDGDYLSVFFDNRLLFNFLGTQFTGNDFLNSGLIPIWDLTGKSGQLLFALNSVGEANASFEIANLQIITASVPEPSTLALLGLGLVALGFSRRRKKTASFLRE